MEYKPYYWSSKPNEGGNTRARVSQGQQRFLWDLPWVFWLSEEGRDEEKKSEVWTPKTQVLQNQREKWSAA